MDELQEGKTEKMRKVFVFVCCCVFLSMDTLGYLQPLLPHIHRLFRDSVGLITMC